MKLSIIIVNYNVKFFLAQCLNSVKLSLETLDQDAEVFVVDNHSVDGSVALIKEQYPWVKLIENNENLGFSKANNQAIKISKGEYILLLNPDTVVEQDTFIKVIEYMDNNPQVGGLGVRMIDGKGNFLPESKRGLPTPKVAFYKISGLSKLFPKSRVFNKYHLGYLSETEIHDVEVLSGAFMLIRRKVLDKIGLLDETFFMYGEDVDLSYRIIQAGYKNIYFPKTTIIHYKGESTKKGSINYVRMFYSAMSIFANKHFKNSQSNFFSLLINIAIWTRALVAMLKRMFIKVIVPLFDFLFFFLCFYFITQIWQQIKFGGEANYPDEFLLYVLPIYAILFVFSLYYVGFYSKKPQWSDLFKGIGLGSLLILSFYALLSEDLRYSRAIVIIGISFLFVLFPLVRYILSPLSLFYVGKPKKKRAIVIGSNSEYKRIVELLNKTQNYELVLWLSNNEQHKESIGVLSDLEEIIGIHKINEIVFCSKDLSPKSIIEQMTMLSEWNIDFKIVGDAVIGSKTVFTDEPTFDVFINSIAKPLNKRNKRLFDFITSLLLIIFSPVLCIMFKNKKQFFKNLWYVLIGKYSWIGYARPINSTLPKIKTAIIPITFSEDSHHVNEINLLYAKDFKISLELIHFLKNINKINQKPKL